MIITFYFGSLINVLIRKDSAHGIIPRQSVPKILQFCTPLITFIESHKNQFQFAGLDMNPVPRITEVAANATLENTKASVATPDVYPVETENSLNKQDPHPHNSVVGFLYLKMFCNFYQLFEKFNI